MSSFYCALLIGLFIGTFIGFIAASLFAISSRSNLESNYLKGKE